MINTDYQLFLIAQINEIIMALGGAPLNPNQFDSMQEFMSQALPWVRDNIGSGGSIPNHELLPGRFVNIQHNAENIGELSAAVEAIMAPLLADKANIEDRLVQGLSTDVNMQGMHIRPKGPFVYYHDWTIVATDGSLIVRTDNNLVYIPAVGEQVNIALEGQVLVPDYKIDSVFIVSEIQGQFINLNLIYRVFDTADIDQRIGYLFQIPDGLSKASVVEAIISLKDYVDTFMQSSEVTGSPYASYAAFLDGAGATVAQGRYSYVTFTDGQHPSGGNWDRIQIGDTWRLDCSSTSWNPTSNMTNAMTATLLEQAGSMALKMAGNDTVSAWLQSLRNNIKALVSKFDQNGLVPINAGGTGAQTAAAARSALGAAAITDGTLTAFTYDSISAFGNTIGSVIIGEYRGNQIDASLGGDYVFTMYKYNNGRFYGTATHIATGNVYGITLEASTFTVVRLRDQIMLPTAIVQNIDTFTGQGLFNIISTYKGIDRITVDATVSSNGYRGLPAGSEGILTVLYNSAGGRAIFIPVRATTPERNGRIYYTEFLANTDLPVWNTFRDAVKVLPNSYGLLSLAALESTFSNMVVMRELNGSGYVIPCMIYLRDSATRWTWSGWDTASSVFRTGVITA